jgi:antitoxin PrlF
MCDINKANDATMMAFLTFLDNDMIARPEALQPIPLALWAKIKELTDGIVVDLDAPLDDEDIVL